MECPYRVHQLETDEGRLVWAVIERCGAQVRTLRHIVCGLDFTAVLALAGAMGVPTGLLSSVLPTVEAVIVEAYRDEWSENSESDVT